MPPNEIDKLVERLEALAQLIDGLEPWPEEYATTGGKLVAQAASTLKALEAELIEARELAYAPDGETHRSKFFAATARIKGLEEGLRTLDNFFDFDVPVTGDMPMEIEPSFELNEAFHLAASLLKGGGLSARELRSDADAATTLSDQGRDSGTTRARGWLPIESAPKSSPDGPPIDVLLAWTNRTAEGGETYHVGEGYWCADQRDSEGGAWWWANTAPGDYYSSPIWESITGQIRFWQPLPSPPCVSMPGDVSATGSSTPGRQVADPGLSLKSPNHDKGLGE